MNAHILLEKIVEYEKCNLKIPENCRYDEKQGLWLWGPTDEILVKSNNPNCPTEEQKTRYRNW